MLLNQMSREHVIVIADHLSFKRILSYLEMGQISARIMIDHLHVECILRNIDIYFQFLYFLNTMMPQVVEICPCGGKGVPAYTAYAYCIYSQYQGQWLRSNESGHQSATLIFGQFAVNILVSEVVIHVRLTFLKLSYDVNCTWSEKDNSGPAFQPRTGTNIWCLHY